MVPVADACPNPHLVMPIDSVSLPERSFVRLAIRAGGLGRPGPRFSDPQTYPTPFGQRARSCLERAPRACERISRQPVSATICHGSTLPTEGRAVFLTPPSCWRRRRNSA